MEDKQVTIEKAKKAVTAFKKINYGKLFEGHNALTHLTKDELIAEDIFALRDYLNQAQCTIADIEITVEELVQAAGEKSDDPGAMKKFIEKYFS
ncbi:MAG: hypothetical protein V1867_06530 [Candidatus Falkowbacteria bacterium]